MFKLPRNTVVIAVMMSSREFPILKKYCCYSFFYLEIEPIRCIIPFIVNAHVWILALQS